MPSFIYISLLFFMTFLSEIQCGNWGIAIPFTALFIHYLSVTRSLQLVLAVALLFGTIIDGYYSRELTLTPFIYLIISLIGHYFVKKSPVKSLGFQFFPGALIGLLCSLPYIVFSNLESGLTMRTIFTNIGSILILSIASGILLPLIIFILDISNDFLELPQYLKNEQGGKL